MKRNILSAAFVLLLCAALSLAVFSLSNICGHYDAVRCEKDGVQYDCDTEYLQLESDGTGVVTFGGTPYGIDWTLNGSVFSFEDEDGYGMNGTYRDGVIEGNYAGYGFIYELHTDETPAAASTPMPSVEPASDPATDVVPAGQPDLSPVAGVYQAIRCEKDGDAYVCDTDSLELYEDGTGTVVFKGTPYSIEWSLSGEAFSFADEDGDILEGTLTDGTVIGEYCGYTFEYVRDESDALPSWKYDGVVPGTYYPTSCQSGDSSYNASREYLVLNEDGSAMLVYEGCAFPSVWELNGESFTLRTDRDGAVSVMTGTLSSGILSCEYENYQYVFRKGTPVPITTLSPGSWNSGLPYVIDQAGLLSAVEVSRLNAEAQRLASEYGCGVYIVTVGDIKDFSPSGSVETCAEEIRVGYDLGLGNNNDCILLLMSMADRSYDLCVFGSFASEAFNEYARSTIESAMLDNFRDDDWYGGYTDYQARSAKLLKAAAEGKPITAKNNPGAHARHIIFPLVFAFIISVIFCKIKKGKMRSVKAQQSASAYIPDQGVNIAFRYDQFTHSTETRVYDPPQSSSSSRSGGGGGGSSSSGHSHSSGHF